MELLGPTLTDLENAGKILGNLDSHYVGQVYPQFKDDLKDLGIPDIDVYGAYNLKNVQDDLMHIQSIAYESPSKNHFAKKIEFLVQLSQRTLKIATRASEDAKKTKKPVPFKNGKPSPPLKEALVEISKKSVEPLQLPALQAPLKQAELKLTPKKMGKIKPMKTSPKKRKDASKTNENIRKKLGLFEGKTLARISEDVINEEASDLDISLRIPVAVQPEEVEEMNWRLTQAQQEMVQNTLKKYNMSEDIWTNYILTRVHGDAQLRRMGIKAPKGKVDCQIETIKFVEELERHMDRKKRALAKRYANNSVTPLQPDQDPQSLDFAPLDFFTAPAFHTVSSTPPAQARVITSSSDSPSPSNRTEREHHSSPVQPLRPKSDNISAIETDLMSQVNAPSGTPTSAGVAKNRTLSKMWNMTPTYTSQVLSKQLTPVTLQADCLDNMSGFMNLQDSLQESLTMDQNSTLHYMKSRGQFRLPSISSSNSHMKRFSQTESPMTGRVLSGRKYRPSTDQSARTMTDFDTSKTEGSQLDDSLEGDSLIMKKDTGAKAIKRPFRLSSLGTVRSKYVKSYGETSGVLNKMSLKESEHVPSLVLGRSQGRARGVKTESDQPSFDVRSDLSSQNELSESFNERSSIKAVSERTMMTVISQESNTKLAFSRTTSQIVKIAEMTETEYCGEVKRICLLGSGSEAKVFLCKIKDYEEELALKQYDLVKNQKRNGEPYDGLIKEFEMLKHLDHENIIKYICLYKPKTTTYHNCLEFGIIMEYMPGGSLDTYIEENANSMPYETKKDIMKQILSGIDFLHQHNIIHRDLKPGNILLSEDKTQVKISDFGISKKTNTDTSTKRTLVGTPWYMAPEVISQEGYSSKADIWSAGCCFFHLIAGQKPYHNANAIQALLLMVNHRSPLETCPPEILDRINEHEGVKEFLELCFNRNKSQRPTAASLLKHPIFNEI